MVAVVAMMGAYQYEKRAEKQEQQEQVTLAEQTDTAETQNTTNADDTQETMVTQKPDQQTENRSAIRQTVLPGADGYRAGKHRHGGSISAGTDQ